MPSAIDHLPLTVTNGLAQLAAETGWSFSMFFGGPAPIAGGAIQTGRCVIQLLLSFTPVDHWQLFSVHVGKTETGNTFSQAHVDYNNVYMLSYTEFICKVYCMLFHFLCRVYS
jgi:hypothetical protein